MLEKTVDAAREGNWRLRNQTENDAGNDINVVRQ